MTTQTPLPRAVQIAIERSSRLGRTSPELDAPAVIGGAGSGHTRVTSAGAAQVAALVRAGLDAAAQVPAVVTAWDDDALTEVARDLLAVLQVCEAGAVAVVAEAMSRGLIDRSTAGGPAQWVAALSCGEELAVDTAVTARSGPLLVDVSVPADATEPTAASTAASSVAGDVDQSGGEAGVSVDRPVSQPGARPRVPGIEPAHAGRLVAVATACLERRNAPVRTALQRGQIGVVGARIALVEVDKVAAVLPELPREEIFGHFLTLPPGAGGRMIRELTRRLVAAYGDGGLDDEHARLEPHESVSFVELPCGMTRLTADLAPDHARIVRHAIDALSAPARPSDCCDDPHHRHREGALDRAADGERDLRSPGKRRADGLLLLVSAGARAVDDDGQVATSGGARVVVTIDHEVLIGRLGGAGIDESGTAISAGTARRLACDAEILPMVLGGPSEPLDVGRAKRLVDRGPRRAVIHRDRHCTFPGCDRPPSWCDVHHVRPWWLGGGTSLSNSALLCRRHHTVVHRDGLVAAVGAAGVTWDLTPGRLPDRVTRAA